MYLSYFALIISKIKFRLGFLLKKIEICPLVQKMNKYTNIQIHKYTNTQIHKYKMLEYIFYFVLIISKIKFRFGFLLKKLKSAHWFKR